jgi:hypothetical protein
MESQLIDAVLGILKASAGFFIVIGIWLGIQAFARKKNGCAPNRDMLDYMLHGCGNCLHGGNCDKSKERARIVTGPGAGTL